MQLARVENERLLAVADGLTARRVVAADRLSRLGRQVAAWARARNARTPGGQRRADAPGQDRDGNRRADRRYPPARDDSPAGPGTCAPDTGERCCENSTRRRRKRWPLAAAPRTSNARRRTRHNSPAKTIGPSAISSISSSRAIRGSIASTSVAPSIVMSNSPLNTTGASSQTSSRSGRDGTDNRSRSRSADLRATASAQDPAAPTLLSMPWSSAASSPAAQPALDFLPQLSRSDVIDSQEDTHAHVPTQR